MFEWDPAEYKNEKNPGWGPCAGRVLDPFGETLTIEWADDETTTIGRRHCRRAPNVGELVRTGFMKPTRVESYSATGCVCKVDEYAHLKPSMCLHM